MTFCSVGFVAFWTSKLINWYNYLTTIKLQPLYQAVVPKNYSSRKFRLKNPVCDHWKRLGWPPSRICFARQIQRSAKVFFLGCVSRPCAQRRATQPRKKTLADLCMRARDHLLDNSWARSQNQAWPSFGLGGATVGWSSSSGPLGTINLSRPRHCNGT